MASAADRNGEQCVAHREQILLGISAGRITPLHVLKEPVPVAATEAAPPEFAQRLMELLGKDQKDDKP